MRSFRFAHFGALAVLIFLLGTGTVVLGQSRESVLDSFAGGTDGQYPYSSLVADAAGNLYGSTYEGGTPCSSGNFGCGTVFELTPLAGGGWQETVLYAFQGGNDGSWPEAGPVLDSHGNLFGVTAFGGGSANCGDGCGTIYELTPSASGWSETVIHRFTAGNDGAGPIAGLTIDASGNLYGTAFFGGAKGGGVVYEFTQAAEGWQERVLHAFSQISGGKGPTSGVIFDSAGNLYGTTQYGGYDEPNCEGGPGCGIVFELSPTTTGSWNLSTLHHFEGGIAGGFPSGNLIFDASGDLYGTTQIGFQTDGSSRCCGTVFQLTPTSGGWKAKTLITFNGVDAWYPQGGLTQDADGNLYGTTMWGGGSGCDGLGCGVLYKLAPSTGGWKFSSLHHFTGGSDGAYPAAGVLLDNSGNLYSTAVGGGNITNCQEGCGVVFELPSAADGPRR